MASCPDCQGGGKQQCPTCAGSGAVHCVTCGGSGAGPGLTPESGPAPGGLGVQPPQPVPSFPVPPPPPGMPGAPPPPAPPDAPAAPPTPPPPGMAPVAQDAAAGAPATAAPVVPAADPRAVQPIKLRDFQAPDGSAKGKVPDEEGWMTVAAGGAIESFNPSRGEMHLGLLGIICMPGGMTATMAPAFGWIVAPYMPAQAAVMHVWPQFRNAIEPGVGYGYVEILSSHRMNWGPDSDTGTFEYRFQRGGTQWHGLILASTSPLFNDDRWAFYYSQFAVPETDDGSVYAGLTECWKAYLVTKKAQPSPAPAQPQAQPPAVDPGAAAIQAQTKEMTQLFNQLQTSREVAFDKHQAAMLQHLRS